MKLVFSFIIISGCLCHHFKATSPVRIYSNSTSFSHTLGHVYICLFCNNYLLQPFSQTRSGQMSYMCNTNIAAGIKVFALLSNKLNWARNQSATCTKRLTCSFLYCAVLKNIHTHPEEGHWKFKGDGASQKPKLFKECTKQNWNFQRGGG